jgi:4-amino-4-deoxychorismate lyase
MSTPPAAIRAWVNGEPDGMLSPFDRGVAYGDGLFETMRFGAHGIPLLRLHLERLLQGCARLGIPVDGVALAEELARCLASAGEVCSAGVAKLIVTRGAGGRGYRADVSAEATRVFSVSPLPSHPPQWAEQGVEVRFCEMRLGNNPQLAGIKHLNRLEQVLARREWDDPRIAEGLLADPKGRIVEAVSCNLFLVSGGRLLTPTIDSCGVEGVMRRFILEDAAKAVGVPAVTTYCERAMLAGAQEIFLCNAVVGVWPVRRLGTRSLPVGPVTRRLQSVVARLFDA